MRRSLPLLMIALAASGCGRTTEIPEADFAAFDAPLVGDVFAHASDGLRVVLTLTPGGAAERRTFRWDAPAEVERGTWTATDGDRVGVTLGAETRVYRRHAAVLVGTDGSLARTLDNAVGGSVLRTTLRQTCKATALRTARAGDGACSVVSIVAALGGR